MKMMEKEIKYMLTNGIIEHSQSEWPFQTGQSDFAQITEKSTMSQRQTHTQY